MGSAPLDQKLPDGAKLTINQCLHEVSGADNPQSRPTNQHSRLRSQEAKRRRPELFRSYNVWLVIFE